MPYFCPCKRIGLHFGKKVAISGAVTAIVRTKMVTPRVPLVAGPPVLSTSRKHQRPGPRS